MVRKALLNSTLHNIMDLFLVLTPKTKATKKPIFIIVKNATSTHKLTPLAALCIDKNTIATKSKKNVRKIDLLSFTLISNILFIKSSLFPHYTIYMIDLNYIKLNFS